MAMDLAKLHVTSSEYLNRFGPNLVI